MFCELDGDTVFINPSVKQVFIWAIFILMKNFTEGGKKNSQHNLIWELSGAIEMKDIVTLQDYVASIASEWNMSMEYLWNDADKCEPK